MRQIRFHREAIIFTLLQLTAAPSPWEPCERQSRHHEDTQWKPGKVQRTANYCADGSTIRTATDSATKILCSSILGLALNPTTIQLSHHNLRRWDLFSLLDSHSPLLFTKAIRHWSLKCFCSTLPEACTVRFHLRLSLAHCTPSLPFTISVFPNPHTQFIRPLATLGLAPNFSFASIPSTFSVCRTLTL